MSVPIIVEQSNGHYVASVLGRKAICAQGTTRESAIAAVRAAFQVAIDGGEIIMIDEGRAGLLNLPYDQSYAESMREIEAEAYREREEEYRKRIAEIDHADGF